MKKLAAAVVVVVLVVAISLGGGGGTGTPCDVHPWMISWVFVHPNSHAGVTGESGTVTLLPPPGELTLEAWHEKYGVRRQTVHAKEGEPLAVAFEYP